MIINVGLGDDSYRIYVERGILGSAGDYLDLDRKVFIVTDEGVPSRYSEIVSSQCWKPHIVIIPAGEESKSFYQLELLLRKMLQGRLSRKDCVIAVGGGVVGDLAGFAAATYMRGIDFYNIPTTVLSQVDSSVGGKTAIDLDGVKNIVGAFYQPKCVLIDPDMLATLPKRQVSNGLAEALKISLTSDIRLFEKFYGRDPFKNIDEIIERSINIKAHVVEQDERESGLRKILNFGHTIGHAIESYEGLHNLLHGECVGLGMLPMCSDELRPQVTSVLKKLGLPVNCPIDTDKVFDAMTHDKKADGNSITVTFVNEPGQYILKTIALSDMKDRLKILGNTR